MGCFSFMCLESGRAIASSSYDDGGSDAVRLFLLKDGKVIEEMKGQYDSYGRVFKKDGDSFEWNTPWDEVCDLMFHNRADNGIAAILECYWSGVVPTERSNGDEDQGWGECNGQGVVIDEPYHKVY